MLPDFEIITHHFDSREDITIIPVADVHLGAAQQMEEKWMSFLKMVEDTPNVYLVLAGDLLNNGIKQSVSSIYKERYMPSVAKKMMMEMLEPVKDRILCGVCGNHERRSVREVDDDPMYDIMFALGKSNLYRENVAFVKIQLGNHDKSQDAGLRNPTYMCHANKRIKAELKRSDELKAAGLEAKHKRSLFMSIREYESVSCSVEISRVYDSILSDKKSICRYKDYVLKRCIKAKLQELIRKGKIRADEGITIEVNIDEQLTATDGYYTLRDSIREELQHGIQNFDYGTFHEPVFNAEVNVHLKYCESKNNYMIQASDILANRVWTSFRVGNVHLLSTIPNHLHLTFP